MIKDNISRDIQEVDARNGQKFRSKFRPKDREGEESSKVRQPCGFPELSEDGSSVLQTEVSPKTARRGPLNKNALFRLDQQLTDRDKTVLASLKKYRFLLTGQLQRLHFYAPPNETARATATTRTLRRLREYGLIQTLERRVGGARSGSGSMIWHLTEAGYRFLQLHQPEEQSRTPVKEPSTQFLAHTLSVAECAIQMESICRPSKDLDVIKLETEPPCWRSFQENGKTVILKPDLYAVTRYDGYEDYWFMEVDLGTESTSQVTDKCKVYRRYFFTEMEQAENDVFPLVVCIVPDEKRKEKLKAAIRSALPPDPKMFLIITPDQLERMLRQFIGSEEMC